MSRSVSQSLRGVDAACLLTFRKQAGGTSGHMATKKPAITKVVISLDEFNAVALSEAQLIGAAGKKVMDDEQDRAWGNLSGVRGLTRGHRGVLSRGGHAMTGRGASKSQDGMRWGRMVRGVPCRLVTKGEAAVGDGAERWRVRRLSKGRAETNASLAAHENYVLVSQSQSQSQSQSGSGRDSTSAEVLGDGGRAASAVLHVDAVNDSRRFGATRR